MKDARQLFASLFAPPGWKSGGGGAVCIPSSVGAADAFLATALAAENRVVLAVTPGIPDAERLADDLKDVAVIESQPKMEGRNMHMLIAPLPSTVKKKEAAKKGDASKKNEGKEEE